MIDTVDDAGEGVATPTAVVPSWPPIKIAWARGADFDIERLLQSLGDGVVRTVDAFVASLADTYAGSYADTSTDSYADSRADSGADPVADSVVGAETAENAVGTEGPVVVDSAVRIDRIAALEKARAVLAAAQLAEELAFAEQQRAAQVAAGVAASKVGRGIAEQVGFARRVSPTAASRHIGLAVVLSERLPRAWKQLWAGAVSEDQCRILANSTSHLSEVDAQLVDAGIAPRMSGWNKKQTEQAADRAAYQVDPRGLIARRCAAEKDRRVWVRPGKDGMANLGASLPLAQGVQVYATLRKTAEGIRGVGGETRTLNQVMADLLVTSVTGQEQAHLVPVTVTMTITADALLNNGTEPAHLDGAGPIPAELARAIITGQPPGDGPPDQGPCPDHPPSEHREPGNRGQKRAASDPPIIARPDGGRPRSDVLELDVTAREFRRAKAWLQRILVDPVTGVAVNMDSRKREFDGILRRFLTVRDRTCRHAYCGADIRHADHIKPYRQGGATSIDNGQGLCERGNYAKDIPGWHTRTGTRPGEIIVTTPTGHRYATLPPHQTGMPGQTRRC